MIGKGFFVTFEGGEGVGKSTQIEALARSLSQDGYTVVITREPGGSPGAEAIRHVVLSGGGLPFGPDLEAVLFAAARNDNVERIIRPALDAGHAVICDRFMDSSIVYQGGSMGADPDFVEALQSIVTVQTVPDLTILLDMPTDVAMNRLRQRQVELDDDRFETDAVGIQNQRREAFLQLAYDNPERIAIVDAAQDQPIVEREIRDLVARRMTR